VELAALDLVVRQNLLQKLGKNSAAAVEEQIAVGAAGATTM